MWFFAQELVILLDGLTFVTEAIKDYDISIKVSVLRL